MKIYFTECQERHSAKYRCVECLQDDTRQSNYFADCQRLSLGKVNDRQLLTALYRASCSVESLTLSNVLVSVNEVIVESLILPRVTLSKVRSAECPTKCTQRRALSKEPDSGSVSA
jgi:hypothetical protein